MQITEVLQQSKKSLREEKELKETNQLLTKRINSALSEFKKEVSLLETLDLKEDLDVKQVSGGDWMVWDTVTDSPAATTRFASPGEAEEYRDSIRAQRASTGGDDDGRNKGSNRNRNRLSRAFTIGYRKKFQGFGRIQSYRSRLVSSWTYLLASAMGITIDHTSIVAGLVPDNDEEGADNRSFEAYLDDVYLYAQAGFLYNPDGLDQNQMIARMNAMSPDERNEHAQKNYDVYEQYVLRSYGVVVGAYYAAIIAQLITAGGAIKNIRRFIQALRTIRLTATALSMSWSNFFWFFTIRISSSSCSACSIASCLPK